MAAVSSENEDSPPFSNQKPALPTTEVASSSPSKAAASQNGLSQEQIAAYLVSGGSHCPRCRCEEIGGEGSLEIEGGVEASQLIQCNHCSLHWRDLYVLSGWNWLRRAEQPPPGPISQDQTLQFNKNQPIKSRKVKLTT